jgi:hypothetical protein
MPFVENVYEFQARMRCPFIKLADGSFLFENGASSNPNGGQYGYGVHAEPPCDPASRLAEQRRYWVFRVKRAEDAFNTLKNRLRGEPNEEGFLTDFSWDTEELGPMPPEQEDEYGSLIGIISLKRLQEIVAERREKLRSIEQQILDLPENRPRREQKELGQRLDAEAAARARQRISEVEQLTI